MFQENVIHIDTLFFFVENLASEKVYTHAYTMHYKAYACHSHQNNFAVWLIILAVYCQKQQNFVLSIIMTYD